MNDTQVRALITSMTLEEQAEFVAVELLGWHRGKYFVQTQTGQGFQEGLWSCKDPSTHHDRRFPHSLLTGNGMLEIIEAMRERGFITQTTMYLSGESWAEIIQNKKLVQSAKADTLPEAVLRAAYAALEQDDE